ncbi:hypothetical protein ACTFIR_009765 [Dictyostelium discoideum]
MRNPVSTTSSHQSIKIPICLTDTIATTQRELAISMDFIKDMFISAKEGNMIFQAQNSLINSIPILTPTNLLSFLDIQSPASLKWTQKAEKFLHLPANIFKSEVVKTFLDSIKKTDGAN